MVVTTLPNMELLCTFWYVMPRTVLITCGLNTSLWVNPWKMESSGLAKFRNVTFVT